MKINKSQINPIRYTHYDWFTGAKTPMEYYKDCWHYVDKDFQDPKTTDATYLWDISEERRKYDQWVKEWEESLKKSQKEIDRMAREIENPQELPGGSTPSQYGLPSEAKELQDLIEYREMNFAIGNIFKACYRMGSCNHSDKLRDLRKILWFAQRELDKETKS